MCGYLLYPEKPDVQVVQRHLTTQKHRGEDGYGAIFLGKPTDNAMSYIRHLKKPNFLKSYKNSREGSVIVHHRKASVGGVKAHLVHPLSDTDNKVWLMQNGTRAALSDIFNEDSDSLALAEYWNHVSDKALLNMLDGCGVVIVVADGNVWFHNDGKRTFYYCTEGIAKGMYSSTPVEEGRWALVDQYELKKLPLEVGQWDLEYGVAKNYIRKSCSASWCKHTFIGSNTGGRCPSCEANTKGYWSGKQNQWVNPVPYKLPGGSL